MPFASVEDRRTYQRSDKVRAYNRDYLRKRRAEQPETVAAESRRYYEQRKAEDPEFFNRRYQQVRSRPSVLACNMVRLARARAARDGIPFGIRSRDVMVPDVCPVLGIKLEPGNGKISDNSPTLDRRDPALGYVPGNVHVISAKANRLKSNATASELRAIIAYMEA